MITLSITCDARFASGVCPHRLEYVTTDVDAVYRAAAERGWTRAGTRHYCPTHPPKD